MSEMKQPYLLHTSAGKPDGSGEGSIDLGLATDLFFVSSRCVQSCFILLLFFLLRNLIPLSSHHPPRHLSNNISPFFLLY